MTEGAVSRAEFEKLCDIVERLSVTIDRALTLQQKAQAKLAALEQALLLIKAREAKRSSP